MAANTSPIFSISPRLSMVRILTANVNRDGTGVLGDVCLGGTNGTRIDRIVIQATATTTAGMVRFYIFDGASSTRLWLEVIATAITPSGTVQSFRAVVLTPDVQAPLLVLPATYVLRASTTNAESFDIVAHASDY